MEPVYTPEEIAHFAAAYKWQKIKHNDSQKKYYQRNTEARLAYAKKYYAAKKAKAAPAE
jgi:aminoglycoside phosphotransferase